MSCGCVIIMYLLKVIVNIIWVGICLLICVICCWLVSVWLELCYSVLKVEVVIFEMIILVWILIGVGFCWYVGLLKLWVLVVVGLVILIVILMLFSSCKCLCDLICWSFLRFWSWRNIILMKSWLSI